MLTQRTKIFHSIPIQIPINYMCFMRLDINTLDNSIIFLTFFLYFCVFVAYILVIHYLYKNKIKNENL